MRQRILSLRAGALLVALALLYAFTWGAIAVLVRLASAIWPLTSDLAHAECFAIVAAMSLAAILARGPWFGRGYALRAVRYLVWLPIVVGGPAGLWLIGIWWALVTTLLTPQARAFRPEGVALDPQRDPELAAIVSRAAQAAGFDEEATVYLDLGAGIEVGRVRGTPSVVLGLYALAVLTPEQLGALLTHEFAHTSFRHVLDSLDWRCYSHCHRMLGRPRTLHLSAYLFYPRLAFGLRLLQAAARRHEAYCDENAVVAWGVATLAAARVQLAAATAAWEPYHQQVLAPVLILGSRPDLAEGLRHWLASTDAQATRDAARRDAQAAALLSHRSLAVHPPGWLGANPPEFALPGPDASAWALLHSPWLMEEQLVQANGVRLKHVPWEAVARELYLHNWEQVLHDHASSLTGWTARSLPDLCRDLDAVGRRLLKQEAGKYAPNYRVRMAETILAISLAMCVKRAGWNVYDLPGQPLWLEHADQRFEPFALVSALKHGKTTADAFWAQCERAGILDADLGGAY